MTRRRFVSTSSPAPSPAWTVETATSAPPPWRIPALLATDLADYLVRQGVAFRAAHHAVGAVVKLAEQKRVALDRLTHAEVKTVHPAFGRDWVGPRSIWPRPWPRRTGTGMPGPAQVARQFKRWEKLLG
jgi:argininosuccinate lyase